MLLSVVTYTVLDCNNGHWNCVYNLKWQLPSTLLCLEGSKEVWDDLLQWGVRFGGDLSVLGDGVEQTLVAGFDVLGEFLFEGSDLGWVQLVKMSTYTAVDNGNLK